MKFVIFVCAAVAAVLAVSQKENHISDLRQLGGRHNEFCTLMKASEGPSFNPDDVRVNKNLAVMKNYLGKYGFAYNGGVMELTDAARNGEAQRGPGFRSYRPDGIYTDKSMGALYKENQLFDLTPAQWESLLGDRASQTCDSTTYKPTSQAHKMMKFPEVSCNTICRTCFPYSLPICLKTEDVKTCYCTLDSAKPIENFIFRITDDSTA